MSAQQNSAGSSLGKPLSKKTVEFVLVDEKTRKGYLTFYRIDEATANAIIAAAEIIFRNSEAGPANHA